MKKPLQKKPAKKPATRRPAPTYAELQQSVQLVYDYVAKGVRRG